MTEIRIGILAEDATDCDAVGVLVKRIANGPRLAFKKISAKGCTRLRKHAGANLRQLAREGCAAAIIVHDLDRNPNNGALNDLTALEATLEAIEVPRGLTRHICVPVEELEAWFWADPKIVSEVGRGQGKDHTSPHLIRGPKEALIRLSANGGKKPRYSTNDNPDLAERLNLELCAARCAAFRELRDFIVETVCHGSLT